MLCGCVVLYHCITTRADSQTDSICVNDTLIVAVCPVFLFPNGMLAIRLGNVSRKKHSMPLCPSCWYFVRFFRRAGSYGHFVDVFMVSHTHQDTTDGRASDEDNLEVSEVLKGMSTATASGGSVVCDEDDLDTDT